MAKKRDPEVPPVQREASEDTSPDLKADEIVHIASTNERVSSLISQLVDGSLVPHPEFQRRLVWTDKHKRLFIETDLPHEWWARGGD